MIYCQFQMLIIDYCLDMFRASLCPKHVETVVNNQHLELTINHLYCCILLVFFLHAVHSKLPLHASHVALPT